MKKFIYAALVFCFCSATLKAQVIEVRHFDFFSPYIGVYNGKLIFIADTGSVNSQIWTSDGTEAGTVEITHSPSYAISPVSWPTEYYQPILFNNSLYYLGDSINAGIEIWKSDGTTQGTHMFKDIYPGSGGYQTNKNTSPYFCIINNTLVFAADDGTHGDELWKTDGTVAGTTMIKDISLADPRGSHPGHMFVYKNKIYFTATTDTDNVELFTTDGTTAGTVEFGPIVHGKAGAFNNGAAQGLDPQFTISNNKLFFIAAVDSIYFHGDGLWCTDGTLGGTTQLYDSLGGVDHITDVNGTIFFSAFKASFGNDFRLCKSDGTKNGTVPLTNNDIAVVTDFPFFSFSNKLYFCGQSITTTNFGLCVSDGTDQGTYMLYQFPDCEGVNNYQDVGGSFFFTSEFDVTPNVGQWLPIQSNGTASGEKLFWGGASPIPDGSDYYHNHIMYNGSLYFFGLDSTYTNSSQGYKFYKITPEVLPTGVQTIAAEAQNVSAYPVPFTNVTELKFAQPLTATTQYALYDITGRQVQSETLHQGMMNKLINRDGLPAGMYMYRLNAGGKTVSEGKIVAE